MKLILSSISILLYCINQAVDIRIPPLISLCPNNELSPGSLCSFEGTCYWGKESCCGQTFDSFGCDCFNGRAACFYTDACLGAPTKCGTTQKPLPTKPICGGFDHCQSYNNGCNDCECGEKGMEICNLRFCPPDEPLLKPRCIKCKEGYELNEYDQCVKRLLPPSKPCGGFKNCEAYNDGCNNCQCGENGLDACTKKGCPLPELKPKPKCIACKDGYELNKYGRCIIENKPKIASCGGIAYCQSFKKDVCNKCGCGDPINHPDVAFCTLIACADLPQPECTNCIDGYILNDMTKLCEKAKDEKCCDPEDIPVANSGPMCTDGYACCPNGKWSCGIGDGKTYPCGDKKSLVIGEDKFGKICENDGLMNKVKCKSMKDCDIDNGYKCKPDPQCLGNKGPELGCALKKICLNVDGMCMFNANCQGDHQCVMINDKTGFCVKYQ